MISILQLPQQFLVIVFELRIGLAQQGRKFAEHGGHVELVPTRRRNHIGNGDAGFAISAPDFVGSLPLAIQAAGDHRLEGHFLGGQVLAQQVRLPVAQIGQGIVFAAPAGLPVTD
jgi:hypothetical protein